MFACRSRSALIRLKARETPLYPIPPRAKFSTITPLRQPTIVENAPPQSTPNVRLPLALQAIYYQPFRRPITFGLPVCDLQLRSYSVRNLEFMCDFALRAAYYCHLPVAGPVPLPKKTERWTVPRGHFVHKKSQENFERVTHKRLIQIKDGHPETVELWLAFLRKHQYYGVGMKANLFGFDELGVGKRMGVSLETLKDVPRPRWIHFGSRRNFETAMKAKEILESEEYRSLSAEPEKGLEGILDEAVRAAAQKILESPEYKALVEEAAPVEEQVVSEEVITGEEQVRAEAEAAEEQDVTEKVVIQEEQVQVEAEAVEEALAETPEAKQSSTTPIEAFVEVKAEVPVAEPVTTPTEVPAEAPVEPPTAEVSPPTPAETFEPAPEPETLQDEALAPTPTESTPEPETAQAVAEAPPTEATLEPETTQAEAPAPAEVPIEAQTPPTDTPTVEKTITEEKTQSEAPGEGALPQSDVDAKGGKWKEGW